MLFFDVFSSAYLVQHSVCLDNTRISIHNRINSLKLDLKTPMIYIESRGLRHLRRECRPDSIHFMNHIIILLFILGLWDEVMTVLTKLINSNNLISESTSICNNLHPHYFHKYPISAA